MCSKKLSTLLIFSLIALMSINFVSAITASIGNSRMILRVDQGDVIEKYILVKNVNDFAVDIKLFVSGELKDYIDVHDEAFRLNPGEEKKAYFTINAKKAGTTETQVNVQFTPIDGGNGAGLSSTVIVIAEDKGLFGGLFGNGDDETDNTLVADDGSDDENPGSDVLTGSAVGSGGFNGGVLFFVITLGVFLVLLIVLLLVMVSKKSKVRSKLRKRVRGSE